MSEQKCVVCGSLALPGHVTCSQSCHDFYVAQAELMFGKFKKVIDETTKIAYKVPTRYVIECGLKQTELSKFPVWADETLQFTLSKELNGDRPVVEVRKGNLLVATIYPHEESVAIVSKYLKNVKTHKGFPPVVEVVFRASKETQPTEAKH